jgi:hypothetical protein
MARSSGIALMATLFVIGSGISTLGAPLFWTLILSAFVALLVLAYLSMEKCPACNARGTLHHLHTRKDGKPDGRYKINPIKCSKCGAYKPASK